MRIEVTQVPVDEVTPLRELYRKRMNCQIIMDSFARRGFSTPHLLRVEGRIAGYGMVAQQHYPDTLHEFYVSPDYLARALPLFRQLLEVSQARQIRAQTNDRLMSLMLYDCGKNIAADAILFEDAFATHLTCPSSLFREVADDDRERLKEQNLDSDAHWMLEYDGMPVAAGGLLFHYNPPFGDIYMAVEEAHRRKGFGSYFVQELKRIAYEIGKTPAARCNSNNEASRRTLQRAGLLPCGRMLSGDVAT